MEKTFQEMKTEYKRAKKNESLDSFYDEMHDLYHSFLEDGCDPSEVAKMISPDDLFDDFDLFKKYGAVVDPDRLLETIWTDFVREHWDEYLAKGVSENKLVLKCYECIEYASVAEMLLNKGIDASLVMELCEGLFMEEACDIDDVKEAREIYAALRKQVADEKLQIWIHGMELSHAMIRDIVADSPDAWKSMGIDPGYWIDEYIQEFGWDAFDDSHALQQIVKLVTPERFLAAFQIQSIITEMERISATFADFIDDWKEAGGTIEALVEKFKSETGQWLNDSETRAAMDLLDYKADAFDYRHLIGLIDTFEIKEDTKSYCHSFFAEKGVPDEYLACFV